MEGSTNPHRLFHGAVRRGARRHRALDPSWSHRFRVSLSGKGGETLAIPRSALIQTGERQIAFVEQSAGVFAPREVKTGVQGKDFVEVLSGLSQGETVVTSANFLIDSESRIGAIGAAPAGSAGQPAQSLGGKPTPGVPPQ